MSILVTGGTGYIGSHLVHLLRGRGDAVVVVDDLVTGIAERIGDTPLVVLDLAAGDAIDVLADTMREHQVEAVVHFAGRKQVPESVAHPAKYYRDNLGGMANLLLAMEAAEVSNLVFSSSAAVYGEPDTNPVREDTPQRPINPYGETKLYGEHLITDAQHAGWLHAVSLRYFNVAGALRPDLSDRNALNLIPMVIERVLAGQPARIFGDDYDTPDGTCIRDFVHVVDLAAAHLAALDALARGRDLPAAVNIGTGTGASVAEVIDAIAAVSGREVEASIEPRRAGDPPIVVGDVTLAREALQWQAQLGLDEMVRSAWEGWVATH